MNFLRLKEIDFKGNINNRVFATFLAGDVSVRVQKDRVTKYIALIMLDGDVSIEARLFGASDEAINLIKDGKVYNAILDIKPYERAINGYSCVIYDIEESNVPPDAFVEWSKNLTQSIISLQEVLADIANTVYGQITGRILYKNWDKFVRWTAATTQHHTRLGELVVHTMEVVELSKRVAEYFNSVYEEQFINIPLLLASAILHDLEKINELDVNLSSGKTSYTAHSSLSTHIMDILSDVDITVYQLGLGYQSQENDKTEEQLTLEREAISLLKHCLASHHGKLEYGSPIAPNIPEAYILNLADELSAEMYKFNKEITGIEPGKVSVKWDSQGIKCVYRKLDSKDSESEESNEEDYYE